MRKGEIFEHFKLEEGEKALKKPISLRNQKFKILFSTIRLISQGFSIDSTFISLHKRYRSAKKVGLYRVLILQVNLECWSNNKIQIVKAIKSLNARSTNVIS